MNAAIFQRRRWQSRIKNAVVYGVIPGLSLILAALCLCLQLFSRSRMDAMRLPFLEELHLEAFAMHTPDGARNMGFTTLESVREAPVTEAPGFVDRVPDGIYPIVETTISNASGLINSTDYGIDPDEMLSAAYPFAGMTRGEDPIVLVLHTHATESYYDTKSAPLAGGVVGQSADVVGYYAYDSDVRSTDNTQNVVAVGEVFCQTLEAAGIRTLHCTTQHDLDYSRAYGEALNSIEAYLTEYPSIRYIIDLHRDTLLRADCSKLKPTSVIDGEKCAQVMLVIGAGSESVEQPHWRENLALNYKWQSYLMQIGEGFARPMYLRYGRFNQHTGVGTMLIEVGSCGNTLTEASRAGAYAAEALAEMILENE